MTLSVSSMLNFTLALETKLEESVLTLVFQQFTNVWVNICVEFCPNMFYIINRVILMMFCKTTNHALGINDMTIKTYNIIVEIVFAIKFRR